MKCKTKINSIYMILFVINFILMFLMLSCVCPYLYVDEAAIGVSTYTLSEFGTDRYGNSWPIYIQNFYGGHGHSQNKG